LRRSVRSVRRSMRDEESMRSVRRSMRRSVRA